MQDFNQEPNEGNIEQLTEQQKQDAAIAYQKAMRRKKIYIAAMILIFACVVFYVLSNTGACSEYAMEQVSQPELVVSLGGEGFTPTVHVQVRNKSSKAIKVRFECVVYDVNGKQTTRISSPYELIMAGETVEIVGTTSESYSFSSYSDRCARISELQYSVLKNV